MVDNVQLSKILKGAMKTGKYTIGARETIASMKGSKAVICTRSIPSGLESKIRDEAKKHDVTVVEVAISSAELARLVGRPYRVSAMGIRTLGEADLKALLR